MRTKMKSSSESLSREFVGKKHNNETINNLEDTSVHSLLFKKWYV